MKRTSLLTGALLFVLSLSLHAQSYESIAGLRLRLDTGGSRSAAMGGTSEATDDPLAALRNPAVLARLHERTIAVDAHQNDSSTDVITSGTVGAFNTVRQDAKTSRSGSAILILPTRGATWAVFVDEPLRAATGAQPGPGALGEITMGVANRNLVSIDECNRLRGSTHSDEACTRIGLWSPATRSIDARVSLRRLGTAVAVRRGALSLGASAQYAQFEQSVREASTTVTTAGNRELMWTAGLQWQVRPRLQVGASYQSGAQFPGTAVDDTDGGPVSQTSRFRTPTSYGGGVALEITPNLTVAADAVHVLYSDVLDSGRGFAYELVMPDVTELHGGVEYRVSNLPIALRAGWWRDPSHRARLIDLPMAYPPLFPAAALNLELLDEDEDHLTAGIGFGRTIRVDAAVDHSKHTTRGSLTVATKF